MTDTSSLQLDRAEFNEPATATACAMCAASLQDVYYEADGQTVCAPCCERLRAETTAGTGVSRAVRAVGAGALAMFAGSILYWGILAMTGYEFGLIAIVVGVAVGKAVSWGSYGRGGWKYQGLAMVMTYMSIVSAYVPIIVSEIRKQPATVEASTTNETTAAATPQAEAGEPVTAGAAAVGILMLVGVVLALPFLAGVENIIGIIIIGIGLYEAWKFNRKRVIAISGPHALAVPHGV